MATRDRTQDYLSIRALQHGRGNSSTKEDAVELVDRRDERADVGPSSAIQIDDPRWVAIFKQVRQLEAEATRELNDMGTLIDARLKVGGSNRDLDAEERAVEVKHQALVRIFKEAMALVKRLSIDKDVRKNDPVIMKELTRNGDEIGTDTELAILRNASMCLAQELETLNTAVKSVKSRYLRTLEKQRLQRDRVSGGEQQKRFEERMRRNAQMDEYVTKGLTQDQIQVIEVNTRLADEQNEEFRRILEGIKTLNEMFQDLHSMVIEQGSVLDRIDHNMNMAHTKVIAGRKQIEQANKHLEASSFTLCVLLLVVMVLGLLIALLLKVTT